MSSIFSTTGTTSSSNSFYNMFFSTGSSTSSSSSSASGIFSGSSTMLGDYSMIKSGAYKKLLTSYYASQTSSTDSTTADSTADLQTVKSDAGSLKDAADALNKSSLYTSTGTDEDGDATYDRDAITSAVKKYVEAYNSYIDSSGDVSSTSILKKTLSITKNTSANSALLSEIGISIKSDNTLEIDEDKLNSANVTTISTLFNGSGSYGDTVSQRASESYKVANSTAYTNTRASSYTYNGSYSILGTTNGVLDEYL